ncbi:YjzD family protein [Carnobacterium gallinarum]|uniref:YjzD family protein n=1 Tax=Carnobacterium gallinarum TaxID=2749 RepID=UPI00054FB149|nr:YjzD family protein [Carnobacterium gallinarum]
MKYIVTLFWAFCLGQAAYYIGSALGNSTYDFKLATLLGLVGGVLVIAIGEVLSSDTKKSETKTTEL